MLLRSASNWVFGVVGVTAWMAKASFAQQQVVTGFNVTVLESSPLPQALSDMTAVVDPDTGKVFIHGGCNSPNGNEYDFVSERFGCSSLSSTAYVFDIPTQTFNETAPMPVARYRHAAVFVNNQVWLVGGRNLTDSLVDTVDVYDIGTDTWKTYTDLSDDFVSSDLAGFATSNMAYFAGGYSGDYTAMDTVFTIDPVASNTTNQLVAAVVASLPTARGDTSAVAAIDVATSKPFALVTGGFTHENGFCTPLNTSERFDFDSGMWTETTGLTVSRADKALVVLADRRIFALGGERQIPNFCEAAADQKPAPGEETVPIVDVEWYDESTDDWKVIADLPRHRFRFVAVGYNESIYSFGGQLSLDKNCTCFKTSNEVIVYKEFFGPAPLPTSTDGTGSTGSSVPAPVPTSTDGTGSTGSSVPAPVPASTGGTGSTGSSGGFMNALSPVAAFVAAVMLLSSI